MLSLGSLILGMALVIIGANGLVEGAGSLAKRLKVTDLVIGLTVVAFGTSAPEFTVSVYSAWKGESDIAVGNVVGSNIFNVLVILGLSALVFPLRVHSNTIWKEIPLGLLAALILVVCANDVLLDGDYVSVISRIDGIILLGFFVIFLYYTFDMARKQPVNELHNVVMVMPLWKSLAYAIGGLVLLVSGGKFMVDGAVSIATQLGMSKSAIALTIVAAGTSLPELATSLVAAYKRNADIAVGNVVGSNIFNIFFILGTAGAIHPLGMGNVDNLDLLICLLASVLLMFFSYNARISRAEGFFAFLMYIAYTLWLFLKNPIAY